MVELLTKNYIGGVWRDAGAAGVFDVTNPTTGDVLATVADAGIHDMQDAIDAAHSAQAAWARTPAIKRAAIIHAAARIMEARINELAEIITLEQGKPLDQARGEITYGIGFLDWFAEEGLRVQGISLPASSADKRIAVHKQPVGVTVAITPWNFPSLQILRKLGAALAAGCAQIIKPSELTPLSALEIARCFDEAGLPAGVLSVVCSSDPIPVTEVIMKDARVRAVSFTGSTAVGKILMRGAADTMKRVSLELGGHAPIIVFEDADLDIAADQAVASKMRNMGQTCVSVNRIIVHESVADRFLEKLIVRYRAQTVGDPLHAGVTVGPLIEDAAMDKVERQVADAIERGARIALGGSRTQVDNAAGVNFFEPTIITNVDYSMLIATEETFGPMVAVMSFSTEEEAIIAANNTPYGLSAYFFTNDLNRSIRVAEQLDYGTVGLNDAMISAVQAPFGGIKESGIGREGGTFGLDEYLDIKYVSTGSVSATGN